MKKIFYCVLFLLFESFYLQPSLLASSKAANTLLEEFKQEIEKNKKLIEECIELLNQKMQLIEKYSKDNAQILDSLKQEITDLNNKKANSENLFNTENISLEVLKKENKGFNDKILELTEEIKKIKQQLDNEKKQFEAEIEALKKQNEELEQKKNMLESGKLSVAINTSIKPAVLDNKINKPNEVQSEVKTAKTEDEFFTEMKERIDAHKNQYEAGNDQPLENEYQKIKQEFNDLLNDNTLDQKTRHAINRASANLDKYVENTYPAKVDELNA